MVLTYLPLVKVRLQRENVESGSPMQDRGGVMFQSGASLGISRRRDHPINGLPPAKHDSS